MQTHPIHNTPLPRIITRKTLLIASVIADGIDVVLLVGISPGPWSLVFDFPITVMHFLFAGPMAVFVLAEYIPFAGFVPIYTLAALLYRNPQQKQLRGMGIRSTEIEAIPAIPIESSVVYVASSLPPPLLPAAVQEPSQRSEIDERRFGGVFPLMQLLALPILFVIRSPKAKLGAPGLGHRGESRLDLFIPDGTPRHIIFRFIEPAVWISFGILLAWRAEWSLPLLVGFIGTGVALHMVEQTYYEMSFTPSAARKEMTTGVRAPVEDRLAKLADLQKQNLITQTEYEAKKQLILNDL